jgi:hypothetical protein
MIVLAALTVLQILYVKSDPNDVWFHAACGVVGLSVTVLMLTHLN